MAKAAKQSLLLVGTRQGAFILRSNAARRKWETQGPHFLGCIIHHMVLDPRDGKTLLVAARTGHLGPTVYRIHGTNRPDTIGTAVSSGCFRLVNADVIDLYDRIPVGTKVIVRQQPSL